MVSPSRSRCPFLVAVVQRLVVYDHGDHGCHAKRGTDAGTVETFSGRFDFGNLFYNAKKRTKMKN